MKNRNCVMAGVLVVACLACSCATGSLESAALVLGKSSEAPVFLSCKAVTEKEIHFEFSRPVTVTALHFSPMIRLEAVEGGSTVRVSFSDKLGPGERITADLLAEDDDGNTINVLVPLRARNNRLPRLCINELRTEYSNSSSSGNYRCEFVEFKTFSTGNLGALRLFVAGNYKAPMVYEFPPAEVQSGEYIVLHLRTADASSRDELGSNLRESGGPEASPTARDLWVPGTTKLLHKTDAVYLLDQDDGVVDAVMLSEKPDTWWGKDYFVEAAEFLFGAGAWKSRDGTLCSPAEAMLSGSTTATRTICRDETLAGNSGTAADWYITVNSGMTPGGQNNPRRYN